MQICKRKVTRKVEGLGRRNALEGIALLQQSQLSQLLLPPPNSSWALFTLWSLSLTSGKSESSLHVIKSVSSKVPEATADNVISL